MISLDKAQALKEAGLEWEPKRGDRYLDTNTNIVRISNSKKKILAWLEVWLPSLSQLLAEIACRYDYLLGRTNGKRMSTIMLYPCGNDVMAYQTWATEPEDAAADALIWILEQEASQ